MMMSGGPVGAAASAWWRLAACADRDPEWWADDRDMRSVAVGICLSCPVREQCLADAIRTGAAGVVRGAMLFLNARGGTTAVSLVCVVCGQRAVRVTTKGHARYCSRVCAAARSDEGPSMRPTAPVRRRRADRVPADRSTVASRI